MLMPDAKLQVMMEMMTSWMKMTQELSTTLTSHVMMTNTEMKIAVTAAIEVEGITQVQIMTLRVTVNQMMI
jgi:hypothetical protein